MNYFKFVVLLLTLPVVGKGQQMQDIFDKKAKVTWLGLDFSGAKFIGDRERFGSSSDMLKLLESWNDLMIKEKSKYDVAGALDKPKVEESLDVTKEHNANLDVTDMFSNDQNDHTRLKAEDIAAIIRDYEYKGLSGTGVMFNVESFNKLNTEGAVWITFINIDNKSVLFTERLTGKPAGLTLRNYWAGSIFDIIEKIKKKEFDAWKKKYSKN